MNNDPAYDVLVERVKTLEDKIKTLKQQTEKLKKAETKWRLLVDNAPNIITIADHKGIVQYINRTVPGLSVDDLIGKHINDFEQPEFHQTSLKALEDAIQFNKSGNYQLKGIGPDARIAWYEVHYGPVLYDNKTNAVMFVLTDITSLKEIESTLKESESHFRAMVSKTPAMLHSIDRDGKIIHVSDYWLDTLGYEREEVVGKKPTAFLTEDSRNYAEEVVLPEYYKTGFCKDIPYQFVKKNGDIIDVLLSAISEKDKHGNVIRSITVLSNVTEHTQAETALKESEERYKSLFERSLDAVFINDFNGNFIDASNASLNLLGYTKEDILSLRLNFATILSENQLQLAFETVNEILKTGTQKDISEFRLKKKDGRHIWVETKGSLLYKAGKPYAIQGIARDITKRKLAEKELKESEERYRLLVETMTEGLGILDKHNKIIYSNPRICEMLGYTPEEMKHLQLADLFDETNQIILKKELAKRKQGKKDSYEIEWTTKDNKKVSTIMSPQPLYDDEGNDMGSFSVITDITEHKKLEQQFIQAQKFEAIGSLAGGIAHDFNNLLMSIQSNISLLLFDTDAVHKNYTILQNIENQIAKGADLTGQLLGYIKKETADILPINLDNLIEETSNIFARTRKEIAIETNLHEAPYEIEGDISQIQQVLFNLYVNAADAMPSGGKIIISTSIISHEELPALIATPVPGKYIKITITDTGSGIDKKIISQIYDPFFTTKEPDGGTGMGLASVYGIITNHRGYIDVDSIKGTGTSFKIYLPASKKQTDKKDVVQANRTVLLIDDEETVLDAGALVLKNIGYTVFSAINGNEAIAVYESNQEKIDLVILDMIMPDMSGSDIFEKLKNINPGIKVLLSSGYNIEGHASELLQSGCSAFIQKPFTSLKLSKCLDMIFEDNT